MKPNNSVEEAVFRSVKRACYAGLDSVTLRKEVAHRIEPMVRYLGYSFSTMDPDTGVFTHAVGEGIPDAVVLGYIEGLYPEEESIRLIDRARAGDIVATTTSERFSGLLQAEGVSHELNTVLCTGGTLWGDLCLIRESGAKPYTDPELRLMRRVAPHVARALRSAATVDAAHLPDLSIGARPSALTVSVPGVVVLSGRNRIELRSQAATAQLEDIADVGVATGETPYALMGVVALLRARHRARVEEDSPSEATLRVRGRSGRWYTLRASLSEPDASGECSVIVTIEPLQPGEVASFLTRLYGLTPREREVVALFARGESTKAAAARLGLSPYTVQEHLGNACEKVGVRGRRALLARLFFDGQTAGFSA